MDSVAVYRRELLDICRLFLLFKTLAFFLDLLVILFEF